MWDIYTSIPPAMGMFCLVKPAREKAFCIFSLPAYKDSLCFLEWEKEKTTVLIIKTAWRKVNGCDVEWIRGDTSAGPRIEYRESFSGRKAFLDIFRWISRLLEISLEAAEKYAL